MAYILTDNDILDVTCVGGKAAALHQMRNAGLRIPEWFVISPSSFYDSIRPEQLDRLQDCKSAQLIDDIFTNLEPSQTVLDEINLALSDMTSNGYRFAVRSSAVDEDGEEHSFAGQLESYLYVPVEEVARRVVDVWRSGFTERVLAYRHEAGLKKLPNAPAVLVQRMVNSDMAGVAFSADPVTGSRKHCVISAVYGLGNTLVSGDTDADTWKIDIDNNIVEYRSATQRMVNRFDKNSIDYLRLDAISKDAPPLNDEQVLKVAVLAREASAWFGRYQDIEWAFDNEELYLLQSRPITALNELPDPDGERNLWDNSNIAESYGGVTTPLTFSFARRAYESVYREFCRILRVSRPVIEANDSTFKRMLGLIQGRVYYNMISWYRVLALLPGFTINRRFMEQMMGVSEGLPEEIVDELEKNGGAKRLHGALRLLGTGFGLIVNHFLLPKKISRFYQRLNKALESEEEINALDATRLCAQYNDLERKLLTRWDAPLINDFFAMIFYGVLRKLSAAWCNDSDESLQNDLLAGEGGMISAEPAKRVRSMAEQVMEDGKLVNALCYAGLHEIISLLEKRADVFKAYNEYLDKFGDRCLDELKLESQTLHDDPLLLLRSVGQLALHLQGNRTTENDGIEEKIRADAEIRVEKSLQHQWLRQGVFYWVLKHARARVRDRENLRFERTRLFGQVRRIFVALGRQLYANGVLSDPRDVFYLEVDEVISFVEGTAATTALNDLVDLRRSEFARYQEMEPPADRFETWGMVYQGNSFCPTTNNDSIHDGDLKGIGCCPGLVSGPVRVVRDPRNVQLKAGEILVAERTDPGWIMLFPASAGILVERGSLLSHSAIVSREMGIPSIVSVPGITRLLKDGDWVEFDGGSGVIRRIEAPMGASNA